MLITRRADFQLLIAAATTPNLTEEQNRLATQLPSDHRLHPGDLDLRLHVQISAHVYPEAITGGLQYRRNIFPHSSGAAFKWLTRERDELLNATLQFSPPTFVQGGSAASLFCLVENPVKKRSTTQYD